MIKAVFLQSLRAPNLFVEFRLLGDAFPQCPVEMLIELQVSPINARDVPRTAHKQIQKARNKRKANHSKIQRQDAFPAYISRS